MNRFLDGNSGILRNVQTESVGCGGAENDGAENLCGTYTIHCVIIKIGKVVNQDQIGHYLHDDTRINEIGAAYMFVCFEEARDRGEI